MLSWPSTSLDIWVHVCSWSSGCCLGDVSLRAQLVHQQDILVDYRELVPSDVCPKMRECIVATVGWVQEVFDGRHPA